MQTREEFLERHRDAHVIVCNSKTGDLVQAEYLYLNGKKRQYPAIYTFPEY